MGQEAQCTARFGAQTAAGRAYLGTDELRFRGEFRLSIPFSDVRSLDAAGGCLTVSFSGGTAVFELGRLAETWAAKIRSPKSVLDKLGVKPGQRITVVGLADDRFHAQLSERAGERVDQTLSGQSDLIFLAAERKEQLRRLASLTRHLKPDGAIWVIRPKGVRQITEADVMSAGKAAGLVDTKVVRFSETHTAEKFVIPVSRRGS